MDCPVSRLPVPCNIAPNNDDCPIFESHGNEIHILMNTQSHNLRREGGKEGGEGGRIGGRIGGGRGEGGKERGEGG